ncbi:SRPBCC domain-containing protein [Micromonospora sp. NPDC005163]
MITIAERVFVPHAPEVVWGVLSDPATVVSCIDGSELGEQHHDGSFDARLAMKFAAIRVSFAARVSLKLEEVERVGRMEARGADGRGSTRVQANAMFLVVPAGAGSEVVLDGVVELNGQLAALVTTGAAVVVDRMTRSFTEKLTATCAERDPSTPAAGPEPAPLGGPVKNGFAARLRRWWQRRREGWAARRSGRAARKVGA